MFSESSELHLTQLERSDLNIAVALVLHGSQTRDLGPGPVIAGHLSSPQENCLLMCLNLSLYVLICLNVS